MEALANCTKGTITLNDIVHSWQVYKGEFYWCLSLIAGEHFPSKTGDIMKYEHGFSPFVEPFFHGHARTKRRSREIEETRLEQESRT
jgi:hypothetical protein